MNIPLNDNAPVKSGRKTEIKAPADIIWHVLTDIERWPEWQKSVTKAKPAGPIGEGTRFTWKAGGLSFKSEIHTCKPVSMFGWTGKTFGANAIHNWSFKESNGITTVTVEECLQGLFPRLFRKFFRRNLDAGMITNLEELKVEAEKRNI